MFSGGHSIYLDRLRCAGRLAGELLFVGVCETRDLWPHPIDLRYFADRVYIYRSLENRCTSVAGTINEIKYLISYRNVEDQISNVHQLELEIK